MRVKACLTRFLQIFGLPIRRHRDQEYVVPPTARGALGGQPRSHPYKITGTCRLSCTRPHYMAYFAIATE